MTLHTQGISNFLLSHLSFNRLIFHHPFLLCFFPSATSRGEEQAVDGGGRDFARDDKEEKEKEEEEKGSATHGGGGGSPGLSPA